MKIHAHILIVCLLFFFIANAQQNAISMKALLDDESNTLNIQQEITYYNQSDSILKNIYLHNWANSFKDRKTPLSKRFIENYRKDLYFAKEKDLGYSEIKNLSVNFENVDFNELKNQADILKIKLNKSLFPGDSAKIALTYKVKFPSDRFTNYGKNENSYHLRYWYITPAVYDNGWQLMSNLNIDDLFESNTNFNIELDVPKKYVVESNLYQYKTDLPNKTNYYLIGKNKVDVLLSINTHKQQKLFTTDKINVYTNVKQDDINHKLATSIVNRELLFIEKYLGKYPHIEIYVDKASQRKNPIYGLNQLPDFLRPFSDTFKWDITMFKAITQKYIENTLLVNKRKDFWLIDGLQNYLLIEYVETFYPELKLLGKVSNSWLLKSFNFSKLDFNDKYPLLYQLVARKFLDQALTTSADSLSNFNRKVISKYKSGLGFKFLQGYVGDSILKKSIKTFYQNNKLKKVSSKTFQKILSSKTSRNLDWFFGDYIKTNKKIDHKIESVLAEKDSLLVTIKNKRDMVTPVALYALKDDEIKSQKWISNVDSVKTVKIKKGDYDFLVLNYENLYPELNTLNNWYKIDRKLFNKPIKFSFLKDVSSPNFNQLFYTPEASYNFYNGLILGLKLDNKPLLKRNFEFSVSPSYATKSKSFLGSFSTRYQQFYEKTRIYKTEFGVSGRTLNFAPNRSFRSFVPYASLIVKRKSLRDVSREFILLKLVDIDKDPEIGFAKQEEDQYSVLSLSYNFSNPDIIKELRYSFSTEFARNFSKAALDLRYRTLNTSDTQLDFRLYAGTFFTNNSEGDLFSFALDRPNDYLFQLNYFGRSEESGIFSQQFIIAEGGFKSVLPVRFANQFMIATNSSIGLWRWLEVYNSFAFLKNRNQPVYFAYETGIRFNFVHEILEFYFPLYSNNGWEIGQSNYSQKIRFTLSANLGAIYNFFRRGFL